MSEPATVEIISEIVDEEVVFPLGNLWSDEPPLESDLHHDQIELLIRILKLWWRDKEDFYASGNLRVYHSPNQKKSTDFREPDFFVVLGTEKKDRKSRVVWQENGKYPNVIVEILSLRIFDVSIKTALKSESCSYRPNKDIPVVIRITSTPHPNNLWRSM